jgi:hypothetical protein
MTPDDFANLTVIEALPISRFRPEGAEDVFRGLAGATIVKIGGVAEDGIEGGGLIIDYRPADSLEICRVVFGFNENGMWVEWSTKKPSPEQVDISDIEAHRRAALRLLNSPAFLNAKEKHL